MKKLFIIGNGFDLHHKLPTRVDDFIEILEQKDVNEYYLTAEIDWSDYEESLSYFALENMAEEFLGYPDYLSDRESDRDGVIFTMEQIMSEMQDVVKESLVEMIENAEQTIKDILEDYTFPSSEKKAFTNNSIFITFNYTSTLEKIYNLNEENNILHIHGFVDNDQEFIFGYSEHDDEVLKSFVRQGVAVSGYKQRDYDEDDMPDYYVHKQYEEMYSFYSSNKKVLRLQELVNFLSAYTEDDIEEVIVLGHSMGNVDKTYFDSIDKIINPKKWIISQYDNSPNNKDVEKYTFVNKVTFCNITDYLV